MLPQACKQTEQNLMHRYSSIVKTAENVLDNCLDGLGILMYPLKWNRAAAIGGDISRYFK